MDVRSYLRSTRFAVVLTGIAVGIPVGFLVTDLLGNGSLGFLAMFVLGVSVPRTYSRSWPEHDQRLHGVAWALGACAVALLVLLVAYVGTNPLFDDFGSAVGAFLVVEVALAAAARSFESDDAGDGGRDDGAIADVDGSD
jgi:peptidoglycan/LPS O-acetylase OafA/YrhL